MNPLPPPTGDPPEDSACPHPDASGFRVPRSALAKFTFNVRDPESIAQLLKLRDALGVTNLVDVFTQAIWLLNNALEAHETKHHLVIPCTGAQRAITMKNPLFKTT
jgi:hypothetical protein